MPKNKLFSKQELAKRARADIVSGKQPLLKFSSSQNNIATSSSTPSSIIDDDNRRSSNNSLFIIIKSMFIICN